jgi:hypothetical protein
MTKYQLISSCGMTLGGDVIKADSATAAVKIWREKMGHLGSHYDDLYQIEDVDKVTGKVQLADRRR